jgi:hypothetical protein
LVNGFSIGVIIEFGANVTSCTYDGPNVWLNIRIGLKFTKEKYARLVITSIKNCHLGVQPHYNEPHPPP